MVSRKKVHKARVHTQAKPKVQTAEGWRREMRQSFDKEVSVVAPSEEEKKKGK